MNAIRPERLRQESGFSSVELVIATPVIVFLFMLLHLGWVTTQSKADVNFAARSAARAASFAQTRTGAQRAAQKAANEVIADREIPCKAATVLVVQSETDMGPNGQVTVTVSCNTDLSRVTILDILPSYTYEHTAIAVIDRLRGG